MNAPAAPAHAAPSVVLRCTVRGCGQALELGASTARCAAGHSFDRARRGFWNLLQPQDRRSANPGDRVEAAQARRRLFERGLAKPLVDALRERLAGAAVGSRDAVLDVGCGEGSLLRALAAALGFVAHGIDLSTPAIAMAAAADPRATFVVANADRFLPYADGSFAAVLSIAARRPVAELSRVLRPEGRLLVAVPADDDLAELRSTLLGAAQALTSGRAVLGELTASAAEAAPFRLLGDEVVRQRVRVDRAALADLLLASYRGQRTRELAGLGDVDSLEVTLASRLFDFVRTG